MKIRSIGDIWNSIFNSQYKNISVATSYSDSPAIDSFGRGRVSTPLTLLDLKQNTDKLPLFYDEQITGSGASATYQDNKASTKMTVDPNQAGEVIRQTFLRGNYQPGKSMLVETTALYNQNNEMKIVLRSKTSGSPVDTVIPQSQWNIDKMDGTGRSGIDVDWSKSVIFYIDFEWLGVGDLTIGIVRGRQVFWVHRIENADVLDSSSVVYTSNPNQPIRYRVASDGDGNVTKEHGYYDENNGIFFRQTGTDGDFYQICATVISEGGQEQNAVSTYISRDGTPFTLANQDIFAPVISLRHKVGKVCTRITTKDISLLVTTNTNYEWALFLAPTIGGIDTDDWQDVSNSSLQYEISRTASNSLSGGYKLAGGYGSSSAVSKVPVDALASSFLTIGAGINGTRQELVLGIKNIDANGGTCYGGINVNEYC